LQAFLRHPLSARAACLRDFIEDGESRHAASRFALGFGPVNLIKKVKVDGEWKFCPAIVDPGRRLNDKVRVNGEVETHNEGTYYIEWREHITVPSNLFQCSRSQETRKHAILSCLVISRDGKTPGAAGHLILWYVTLDRIAFVPVGSRRGP